MAPTSSYFCIACGHGLVASSDEVRRHALARVRWFLKESEAWPSDLVSDAAREALQRHYRTREHLLVEERSAATREVVSSTQPPLSKPPPVEAAAPAPPPPCPVPSPPPAPPPPGPRALPEENGPLHGPPRPTAWQRYVKPFLGESVGWFIGAFLILTGTLYFVADAWAGMSSTVRAFTVFGFAAGWTLVFAAWGRFLGRRPATEAAARALWRIAGAVAPLAAVPLGAASDATLAGLGLLSTWSAVAGVIGWRVGRASDAPGATWLGASMGLATALLGAAPALSAWPQVAPWLAVAPAALALAAWQRGPRASAAQAGFALVAMGWPVLLVAVRLHVALGPAAAPGVHAVTLALLGLGALALVPHAGRRAANALAVVVVAAQAALLVPAFFAPAPSFVVAALLAVVTCVRLAGQRVTPASARWLYPAYGFGYVAFQHVDQLVPQVVVRLFQQLKAALGYASAPLPPSYASVYAALFVVAVGAFAAWRLRRSQGARRAEASALLRATAVAAVGFGLLALASLGADARPALIACPTLAALGLGLGAWLDRRDLTVSGSVVSVAAGLAFAAGQGAALPAGGLALVLALRALPATRPHRWPASLASLALAGLAAVTAFAGPRADASTLLALALASTAALLVARNEDVPGLLEAACLFPVLVVLHAGSPLLLATAALAAALALPTRVAARRRAPGPAPAGPSESLPAVDRPAAEAVSRRRTAAAPAVAAESALAVDRPAGEEVSRRRTAAQPVVAADSAPAVDRLAGEVASRRRALAPAAVVAAVLAPAWALASGDVAWLGAVWLGTAGALGLVARRALPGAAATALEALALLLPFGALWPAWTGLQAFPFLTPALSVVACGVVALGASVHASRQGRGWRTVLLASAALGLAAASGGQALMAGQGTVLLAGAGAVALAATAALLPALTLPLSALCFGVAWVRGPEGLLVLAAVASAVALLESVAWVWRVAFNRASAAVAASAVAALALALAVALDGGAPWTALAVVVLPALWVRATAHRGWAAASVVLAASWAAPQGGAAALLAPALAFAWGRALPAWRLAGRALAWKGRGDALLLVATVAGAAASAAWVEGPWRAPVLVSWCLALVLARDGYAALRLGLAAALSLAWPQGHLAAPVALVGLAFLARQRPQAAARALGAGGVGFLANAAALLAVGTAAVALARGVPLAVPVLQAALAVTALFLDVPALLAVALVLCGLDVRASVVRETLVLTPWAWAAAVGSAGLALALRQPSLSALAGRAWRALGGDGEAPTAAAWWAGLALGAPLAWQGAPAGLAVAALAFVTASRREAVGAMALAAVALLRVAPLPVAAPVLGALGAALAWAGAVSPPDWRVAKAWHHAGWVLALVALALVGADAHAPAFAACWALAAVTAWAVARAAPLRAVGWTVTALALHAVLAHLGLALATGAPPALIFPWFGLASAALAAAAWRRTRLAGALVSLAILELLAALALVPGAHPREAVVAVLAALGLAAGLGRSAVLDDDEAAGVLGQVLLAVALVAVRRLGLGVTPGATEAWLAVVFGAVLAGAARFLAREGRAQVAALCRGGAVLWPLLGLFAAPWGGWQATAPLLAALAVHFTWLSRCGSRHGAPVLAALAFNGAVAVAFVGAGGTGLELLAIPAGLSLLALVQVFQGELSVDARAKLRAVAMAVIYGATALRPLAFPTTWGLVLCAVTCVLGVAAGAVFRIRSYVLLGAVFLVTTVVATLVRYGVQQPRLGALFLSGLGLLVVAVMVVVTTRRAQLQAQVSQVQRMLAQWEA